MTSETRQADTSAEGSAPGPASSGDLIAPDIRVGGRRILLTPHNCFACGQLNVHGLQLDLHADDDGCWTEVVLADRFEGWEGIVHGGIIATILDEVMGWAIIGTDAWGVTARMTLEYKRPVLVGRRYRAEASVVRARRRLVESAARLVDAESGEVVATAEALYVAVPEERKRELKARYAYALVTEDAVPTSAVRAESPERVDTPAGGADSRTREAPTAGGGPADREGRS